MGGREGGREREFQASVGFTTVGVQVPSDNTSEDQAGDAWNEPVPDVDGGGEEQLRQTLERLDEAAAKRGLKTDARNELPAYIHNSKLLSPSSKIYFNSKSNNNNR